MKRILFLAFCAMISLPVGARTLYVDASQPNNEGNGLTEETAKKTIQAAVNTSKSGDTIVVLPGEYAPITTKNKKIAIKAKSGAEFTTIKKSATAKANSALVKLGKTWKKKTSYVDESGKTRYVTESSGSETKGTSTSLTGFTINGTKQHAEDWEDFFGVSGGTLKSCIVKNVAGNRTVCRAKLTDCTIRDNDYLLIDQSTLSRCQILSNTGYTWYGKSTSSKFANCLMVANDTLPIKGCTLANCTIADNKAFSMSSTKAWNTIFDGVASSQFKKKKKNTCTNCYTGPDPLFVSRAYEDTVTYQLTPEEYEAFTAAKPENVKEETIIVEIVPESVATNKIEITIVSSWVQTNALEDVVTPTGVVVTNIVDDLDKLCTVDDVELICDPRIDRGANNQYLTDENGNEYRTDAWEEKEGGGRFVNLAKLFVVNGNPDTAWDITNNCLLVDVKTNKTDQLPIWTDYGKEHRFVLNDDGTFYGLPIKVTNTVEVLSTNKMYETCLMTQTNMFLGAFDGNWDTFEWDAIEWITSPAVTSDFATNQVAESAVEQVGATTNCVPQTIITAETTNTYYRVVTADLVTDYHLQKGSPCINKGTKEKAAKKIFGSKDLDKKKRIKGKTVDIGCYEY